jgi:hypothetical protein
VKRVTVALGIIAILTGSCGTSRYPAPLAAKLQERVETIRSLAENGRPGLARAELVRLVELVASRLQAGRIDEGRATEILEAAEAVEEQLAVLPRTSPTVSPTPTPTDEGDEGQGNDKNKGKGNDDESHGNDN